MEKIVAITVRKNVDIEENDMLNKHGRTYQDYMNRTGQFLPSWKAMKENMGDIE